MNTSPSTSRRLSLLTPSGHLTLGNYLGALRGMVAAQGSGCFYRVSDLHAVTLDHDPAARAGSRAARCFYGVSDLHARTLDHDPAALAASTRELQTLLLAVGLDRSTLFRQSRVPAHTALTYLLECTAYVGELGRMIQYKEKGRGRPKTRASLFTYPVL